MARLVAVGRGRLIDEAGASHERASAFSVRRLRTSTMPPACPIAARLSCTDSQGRFVARGLVADGRCWLTVLREGGGVHLQEFRVKGTKSVDFGEIAVRHARWVATELRVYREACEHDREQFPALEGSDGYEGVPIVVEM